MGDFKEGWDRDLHDRLGCGTRDPDYDYIPPRKPTTGHKKGMQCGECGMKFDYGHAYGYCCMNNNCPTRFGR